MKLARKLSLLLATLVSFGALADVKTTDPIDLRVREVGLEVKCQCGCGSTVADCNMIHCHFGEPVKEEIKEGLIAGLAPDQIIDKLALEYGEMIRTQPPPEGFGAFGWAMPFIAVLIGLAAIPFVIMRWRKSDAALQAAGAETPATVDPESLERFEAEIEKELARED
ncbi:MAG: cytochrome c-type biogenesis protein CcmH [Pirellulales bacterium]|nr:cytochrome c-type biogenesis protein CcmH [Pirellulales bacterium]